MISNVVVVSRVGGVLTVSAPNPLSATNPSGRPSRAISVQPALELTRVTGMLASSLRMRRAPSAGTTRRSVALAIRCVGLSGMTMAGAELGQHPCGLRKGIIRSDADLRLLPLLEDLDAQCRHLAYT